MLARTTFGLRSSLERAERAVLARTTFGLRSSLGFAAMNAFHVVGSLLAIWAVVVSFLGITREGFPNTNLAERVVSMISVVLVIGAIGTAVYTSANEGDEEETPEGQESALLVPR